MQPRLPRDLETICLKCLHKEARRRYGSAAHLADDLERFLDGSPVQARPVGRAERLWRWCKRRPAQAALLFGGGFVAMVLIYLGLWFTAQLGAADARTLTAQVGRERAEILGKLEEARREDAEKLAATHEFYRWFNGARNRRQENESGWTWRNLHDLKAVLQRYPEAAKLPEVHTEVGFILGSIDARLDRELAKGFNAAALAFSPDGTFLALGQERVEAFGVRGGCQILLLDPLTGKQLRELRFPPSQLWQIKQGKPDGARSLAISPDGAWLVVGSRSGRLHRWNLREQNPQAVSWQAHTKQVEALRFDRRGTALFSLGFNESLCRWHVADWKLAATYHQSWLGENFTYDPDTERLVVLAHQDCEVLDAEFLFPIHSSMTRRGGHVVLAAGGRLLLYELDHTLGLYDLFTDQFVADLRLANKSVTLEGSMDEVVLSPDGTLLAIASTDTRQVQIWDLLNGKLAVDLKVGSGMLKLAFSPNGQKLAVTGENTTQVFEVRGTREFTRHALGTLPKHDLALSSHGKTFACRERGPGSPLEERGPVSTFTTWPVPGVLDPNPTRPQKIFRQRKVPDQHMALNADGSTLAFAAAGAFIVKKIFAEENLQHLDAQFLFRWGPDQRLWTAGSSQVRMWNTFPTREQGIWNNALANFISGRGRITALQAGSHWGLAGARDGILHILDARDNTLNRSVRLSSTPLSSLALVSDESQAAVGTETGELFLVRLPGGETLASEKHQEEVTGLAFLNPRLLVSSSNDRSIRVWQLHDNGLTEKLRLPCPGMVRRMQATPDGRQLLLLVEGERGIRCWHLDALAQEFAELGMDVGLPPMSRQPHSVASP
jgi:eukaryotic-like serine/threonine-protein kinase